MTADDDWERLGSRQNALDWTVPQSSCQIVPESLGQIRKDAFAKSGSHSCSLWGIYWDRLSSVCLFCYFCNIIICLFWVSLKSFLDMCEQNSLNLACCLCLLANVDETLDVIHWSGLKLSCLGSKDKLIITQSCGLAPLPQVVTECISDSNS